MATLNYQQDGDARRENRKRLRLKLFGPTKEEVWTKLAEEVGGYFVDAGFWSGKVKVVVSSPPWEITLDLLHAGKQVYTRMRAPYVNPESFRFNVYRRNIFADLAKKFGYQDVEIGDAQFDHDFIIRGNDGVRLQQLFSNPRIRELINAQRSIHFEVRDDEGWFGATFPDGVDELRFMVLGVIKDIDRLKFLYELFAETLHTLCQMGSAYEDDPGVRL